MTRQLIFAGLCLCVVASALEVILQRHETRKLFSTLQELRAEQSELDREWGQLLLEQGTWGTHGRIEDIARNKLDMTVPDITQIYRVRS